MVTVLENLVSELKRSVSRPNKSFLNIPVIDLPKPSNLVKYYKVEGIKEEYFDKLNGTIVTGLPKGSEPSRRVINRAGKTEHNFDGTVKRERVTVPRELLPVISGESLSLPYSYKYRDNQYIDFLIEKSGKKKYIYAVNKRNLYELNMVFVKEPYRQVIFPGSNSDMGVRQTLFESCALCNTRDSPLKNSFGWSTGVVH